MTIAPSAVAGLERWLRSADLSGLSDDDLIDTWTAGTGPAATQASESLRPLYKAAGGMGDTPYVWFDGADDYLDAGTCTPESSVTVIAVVNPTDIADRSICGSGATHQAFQWRMGSDYKQESLNSGSVSYGKSTTLVETATWQVLAVRYDAAGQVTYGKDGVLDTPTAASTNAPDNGSMWVGRGYVTPSSCWSGGMSQIARWPQALTDEELVGVMEWMAANPSGATSDVRLHRASVSVLGLGTADARLHRASVSVLGDLFVGLTRQRFGGVPATLGPGGTPYPFTSAALMDGLLNARRGQVATTSYSIGFSRPPSRAIDGSTGTEYHSTNAITGQWITLDFGSGHAVTVNHLAIYGWNTNLPRNFKLQGSSDNATWQDLLTVAGSGPGAYSWWDTPVVGDVGKWRYIRLLQTGVTDVATTYQVMGEMELWGVLHAS